MTATQTLILVGAGFVAGVMNAIAGGGTIVTFPALLFTGMNAIRANTTSTVALIVGVLGSIASYRKNIPRVAHWLKLFGPLSLIGGLIGAAVFQFAVSVYGGYFGAGIGILMLASLGMLGFHDIHEANTVKAVLGWVINIIAALYFIWRGLVDWPQAGAVAIGSLAGYYVGAWFAQSIPQIAVRRMITGIGLVLSAMLFYKQLAR